MKTARVQLEYELPVSETGVVQGMAVWCPTCRCPVAYRVAVPGGGVALEFYCPNTGCKSHRKAGGAPIRLKVAVGR